MKTALELLAILLLTASSLNGQSTAPLDAQVRLGQRLRIQIAQQPRLEGTLLRLDRDSLSLGPAHETRTMARAAIDTAWAAHRHAGVGAGLGALVGAVPVAIVCLPSTDECGLFPNGAVLVVGASAVGALLGSAAQGWKRVFP